MKNLRSRFERFCYQNRDMGIPNLMLYVSLGCGLVYLISSITQSTILYNLLVFDRGAILHGQIWRLFTYPLTFYHSNVLLMALMLYCYYSLGRAMESLWGTLRFNLFYFCGIVLMDIYCLLFGGQADVTYLNMSPRDLLKCPSLGADFQARSVLFCCASKELKHHIVRQFLVDRHPCKFPFHDEIALSSYKYLNKLLESRFW